MDKQRKTDKWYYPTAERILLAGLTVLLGLALWNSTRLGNIIQTQKEGGLAQCAGGNISRPQLIRAFLIISEGNRERAKDAAELLEAFGDVTAQPVVDFLVGSTQSNQKEGKGIHRIARNIANSQRDSARHPNADDLVIRSRIDCEARFE